MTETEYTPHIVAKLNKANSGVRVHRQNAGTVTTRNKRGRATGAIHGAPAGAADLVGFATLFEKPLPLATFLEVELKGHRTPWPPHQRDRKETVERYGGIYALCRYNENETLEENLARHVADVHAAIAAHRERFAVLRDHELDGKSFAYHAEVPR